MATASSREQGAPVAIVGGTGTLGSGLAHALARAGHDVVIGSRSRERAMAKAAQLTAEGVAARIEGTDRRSAAMRGSIVFLTVPWAGHEETLRHLADVLPGKVLVDTTVPLRPDAPTRVTLPPTGSAALETRALLPADVTIVSAFQNVSATHLRETHPAGYDVLVSGDDADACEMVIDLARTIGLRGWHAGPLVNAVAAEALASVLIHLNRRYRLPGAGIRITPGTRGGP
jgi:NADPH-dependent F420 reductase